MAFVKINRINEKGNVKELLVDTNKIVFLSETEPHVDYDKPTKYEEVTNDETGEVTQEPCEWETTPRYLIAFDNGKHPQFIDKENYEKLSAILLKQFVLQLDQTGLVPVFSFCFFKTDGSGSAASYTTVLSSLDIQDSMVYIEVNKGDSK